MEEGTPSLPFSSGEGWSMADPVGTTPIERFPPIEGIKGRGFWGARKYEGPDKGEKALKK